MQFQYKFCYQFKVCVLNASKYNIQNIQFGIRKSSLMEKTLAQEDEGVLMLLKVYLKNTPNSVTIYVKKMEEKWARIVDSLTRGSKDECEISKSLNIFVPGWFIDAWWSESSPEAPVNLWSTDIILYIFPHLFRRGMFWQGVVVKNTQASRRIL